MKIAAARVDHDVEDIKRLCEILGITTAEQALSTAERAYGPQLMRLLIPKSQFLMESLFL